MEQIDMSMSLNKTIAYVGNFSFPYGNAAGLRVLGNGNIFRDLGYDVIFIGLDSSLKVDSDIRQTKQVYRDFTYYNLPYPSGINGWLSYKKRFLEVKSVLKDYNLYAVISYGSPTLSLFNSQLIKWCRRKSLYHFSDCVDWLSANHGSLLHRIIKYIDNNYQKRILNARSDGVIVISSYLKRFYELKGVKTLIIPPVVDIEKYNHLPIPSARQNNYIKLIYVGIPFAIDGRSISPDGYKDRLDKVIDALLLLSKTHYHFDIYGLTKEQYTSVITRHKNLLDSVKGNICFHGKIENRKAVIKIAEADFTILLRDVTRATTSGFPTKFVETISCGTPIITTRTSDLPNYLNPMKNGVFIEGDTPEQIAKEIDDIRQKAGENIIEMKRYCKESQLFSYKNYISSLKLFLDNLDK